MVIRILRHESRDEPVDIQLIVDTIERNRDRLRTIANMSLTVSGIMISACIAFVLFAVDKKTGGVFLPVAFSVGAVFFFIAACVGIYSSLLRRKYSISTKAQFVEDLLSLYYSELKLLRACFISLLLGLLSVTGSLVLFLFRTMG